MSMKFLLRSSSIILLNICFSLIYTQNVYAKNITLYDQPATNAKAVATLNSDNGMVLIFTSKDKNWIKVGDPSNGNVGWVAAREMNQVPIMYNYFSTGNGMHSIQFQSGTSPLFQTGKSLAFPGPSLNEEQWHRRMEDMRRQQEAIQRNMDELMEEMIYDQNRHFPFNNQVPASKHLPSDKQFPANKKLPSDKQLPASNELQSDKQAPTRKELQSDKQATTSKELPSDKQPPANKNDTSTKNSTLNSDPTSTP